MTTRTARLVTLWVILGAAVVLIVWDIVAYYLGGIDATESRVIRDWSMHDPIIACAAGVLIGHFFWPQPSS